MPSFVCDDVDDAKVEDVGAVVVLPAFSAQETANTQTAITVKSQKSFFIYFSL